MVDALRGVLVSAIVLALCLALGLPPVAGTSVAILAFVAATGAGGLRLRRGSRA